jgi:uncharacterized damage-inducible protein DinB
MLELLWHMVLWREFTISRMVPDERDERYFETNDWRVLDPADTGLWTKGLQELDRTQETLVSVLRRQSDDLLGQVVPGRAYTFDHLLNGMVQHDIYHAGQIIYIQKLLHR